MVCYNKGGSKQHLFQQHYFSFNVYKSVTNNNSKGQALLMEQYIKDMNSKVLIILKIFQKDPFDIIVNDRKSNPLSYVVFIFLNVRGTLWLCGAHIHQLMTHLSFFTLPFTLQLC